MKTKQSPHQLHSEHKANKTMGRGRKRCVYPVYGRKVRYESRQNLGSLAARPLKIHLYSRCISASLPFTVAVSSPNHAKIKLCAFSIPPTSAPYTHQRRLASILLGKQPSDRIADAVHLLMSESFAITTRSADRCSSRRKRIARIAGLTPNDPGAAL